MGVGRNFSRWGQCQHFANPCQVADNAMQMYVHETLNLFYTSKPQRKCPMLRQQSQKCACLAAISRCITIIFTMRYLQIFKTGYLFSQKYCRGYHKNNKSKYTRKSAFLYYYHSNFKTTGGISHKKPSQSL